MVKDYSLFLSLFLVLQLGNAVLVPMSVRHPVPGKQSPPGSPWPLPKQWSQSSNIATLGPPEAFSYSSNVNNCSVLNSAFERYNYALITRGTRPETAPGLPVLNSIYVQISQIPGENQCAEYPKLSRDANYESYDLLVTDCAPDNTAMAVITAQTVWGALRGLETFSQLIWRDTDWDVNRFYINYTGITDAPRYPHRGLMIDTARHYLPPKTIEEILDAMSYNKLNVFHWHIVDDQSFPYVSEKFPELSAKGAFIPGHLIYTPSTVQNVIEQARLRGIRVIFEIDTPGHSYAIGKSHQELLTPCYGDGTNPGTPNYPQHAAYENLDPTNEATYTFLRELFSELVTNVTQDEFVHLGMDEIYYPCWQSSPVIESFMVQNGYDQISQVQEHFAKRHLDMIRNIGAKAIIWQDPIEEDVNVEKNVIVQVWKSKQRGWPRSWEDYMKMVLDKGYQVLLSACWYVNYLKYGQTWRDYYHCDPLCATNITESQKDLILGGEAAIWAEYVDSSNVVARLFPYVGAVAEKLWSPQNASTVEDALWRLDEHRCRLLGRGIHSQPLMTSYCFPEEATNYVYNKPTLVMN